MPDYPKGHPRIEANNHPIRHGSVVGIHNGIIVNDEEILARHGFGRAHPQMTVDSEAIFALAEAFESRASALDECYGSMAAAWVDERRPDLLFAVRGVGRPLWLGRGRNEIFFASTKRTLELVARYLEIGIRADEVPEGALVVLRGGQEVGRERFSPDRSFTEEPLPTVRAPHERASCLERLAALAAAA